MLKKSLEVLWSPLTFSDCIFKFYVYSVISRTLFMISFHIYAIINKSPITSLGLMRWLLKRSLWNFAVETILMPCDNRYPNDESY